MTSLFICGDIINYEHVDGLICSDELATVISSADYAVCNFEAPVGGFGQRQPKVGPHHQQQPQTIAGLKQQGFNLLLLANNHIMDFGAEGLSATLSYAQKEKMDTLGAGLDAVAAYKPLIKEIHGVKIGMVNACEAQFGVLDHFERTNSAGYAWINHPKIDKSILDLKRDCDFVIVFSHAGLEHYAIPQKEWRERYKHFCDLGADIVVGSHPHVPQGYESFNGSLVFYSLGNFYFDSKNYKDKEDQSFAVWVDLYDDKSFRFKPIYHYKKNGMVQLAETDKQINLKSLCAMLGHDYQKQHDQMSLEAYEMIKHMLIRSLLSSMRKMFLRLLHKGNKNSKELLGLHLIRNEAYYFAARHAMELKAKTGYSE